MRTVNLPGNGTQCNKEMEGGCSQFEVAEPDEDSAKEVFKPSPTLKLTAQAPFRFIKITCTC
jgi:hypothetical protein